jgi:precorrin-2 dehydrogenase / sirohydrochlorin ferrochelatase
MNHSYPIMLHLSGKKVIVIGGGKVAERKILSLLESQALITIVSPTLTTNLNNIVESHDIHWLKRTFSPNDVEGAFLVVAATNNKNVNLMVKRSVNEYQLISLVDDPEESNFHLPSSFKRGKLTISVSTAGASPLLASEIRKRLEESFDERYEDYLNFLYDARKKILIKVSDPSKKKELLAIIASEQFLKMENREEEFNRLLRKIANGERLQ